MQHFQDLFKSELLCRHAKEQATHMAQFLPTCTTCRFDTAGERSLTERLEKKLEDDCPCWFNIPIEPKALWLDFVLMHSLRKLLCWRLRIGKLNTIQSMDRDQTKIYADGLPKTQKNSMLQARAYVMEVERPHKDSALNQPLGFGACWQLDHPLRLGHGNGGDYPKAFRGPRYDSPSG